MNQQSTLIDSLQTHFGHNSFRLGQEEIIEDVMNGRDVLGILPTGSGKSICYQLPAKLLDGVTIVVSPLISLMIDQVKQLKAINFKEVVALNSFMNPSERKGIYNKLHKYKLIYASPEILQQKELQYHLSSLRISLFVIDEAHCISQWGHEFRPDYLKLSKIVNSLNDPPILALSATATTNVQNDIINTLNKPTMMKHIYPMDRDNITFCVKEVSGDNEKLSEIINLLSTYRVPTLIYFSSRQAVENIARSLSGKLPLQIAFYHGGMEQHDRITIQQQFMNDQLDVICCTSAFGMGINKKNIRLIIHYHLSPQIEAYIQEVGRAGRDGESSVSLLLFSQRDVYLPKNIIKSELPTTEDLIFTFKQLQKLYQTKQKLPANERETENLFQVNEIQWRFLRYQFENHGIIKRNTIIFEKDNWNRAFYKINNLRKKRALIKENKLNEILEWIQSKECFRKHLYKSFQPSYKKPKYYCCSNCGFTWSDWIPVQTKMEEELTSTWESKLRKLLLIGAHNETE